MSTQVFADFNIKAPLPPKPPREVHLWKKLDEETFCKEAQDFADTFMNSQPDTKSVEENWCTFRESLTDLISKNVPTKMVSSSPQVPWLTSRLLKLCRKKEKSYSKAKKFGGADRWSKYKKIKAEVNTELRKAKRLHIADIAEAGNKEFWKYIKTRHKDNVGVQTLKFNNQTVTDDKEKANALANHFQSVFTRKDDNIPTMQQTSFPTKPDIEFSVQGGGETVKKNWMFQKLLDQIKYPTEF